MKMTDWEIYQLAKHKPRDAKELDTYCKAIFNMDIPKDRSGYCKRHCRQCDPPFEALKSAYFAETPECGWVGGRGTSKTVMIALLASIELLTLEIDVSIISGSKDQSSLILKYMRNQDTTLRGKLWGAENAPKWLFNEREDAKYRLRTVEDKRDKGSVGNEIVAHAAAESSIRGSHPLRARLDECVSASGMISLRYGKQIRIDEITPGSVVLAWDGTKIVEDVVDAVECKGTRPVLRFTLADGRTLDVTDNHPILIGQEWKHAKEIRPGQKVRTLQGLREADRATTTVEGGTMVGNVPPMSERGERCKSASLCVWEKTQHVDYQAMQGLSASVHDEQPTEVHGLRCANCLRSETMYVMQNLQIACCHSGRSSVGDEAHWVLSGVQQAVETGTQILCAVLGGSTGFGLSATSTCLQNCRLLPKRHQHQQYSAQRAEGEGYSRSLRGGVCIPVSHRPLHSGLLPTEVRCACGGTVKSVRHPPISTGSHAHQAALLSQTQETLHSLGGVWSKHADVGYPTPGDFTTEETEVVSVEPWGDDVVYDIAVRNHHNFIANGIVVHNCDLAEWGHIETTRGLPTEDVTRPDARTHILYASTYHVYNGTMSRLIKELRAKGFPVFSWCVFEQMEENGGFITRRYLADKMRTYSKIKWDIEYMNNGPIAGVPILDPAMLAHRFDPTYGSVPGLPNVPWELTDTPSKMTRHYHGIDWAKAEHWTVFDTLIRADKGFQQAAWYRTGRKPWPEISRDAARHVHRFLGPVAHDATGVGAAMDDWLVEHRVPRSRISGINWRKTTLIKEMATAYVGALQSGEIVGPDIEFAKSEHEYLTEAMLYDDDHCPDSVAAAMMAYWMARQSNRRTSPRPMRIRT